MFWGRGKCVVYFINTHTEGGVYMIRATFNLLQLKVGGKITEHSWLNMVTGVEKWNESKIYQTGNSR
jgi:hypothetical protein